MPIESSLKCFIGIGTVIADRPSHTTVRTDRVYGGSADQAGGEYLGERARVFF